MLSHLRLRHLAVIGAVLAVTTSAQAISFGPFGQRRAEQAAANQANRSAQHQLIQELHQTKVLLEEADHDYKGHRAKAVEEITHAIHALGGGMHHPNGTQPHNGNGQKPAAGGTGQKGNKEPQAQSDAQLKQAMQQLQTIAGQLSGHTNNQHAAKALTFVNAAMGELKTALSIK